MNLIFDWLKGRFYKAFGWNTGTVVEGPKKGETIEWGTAPVPPVVGQMANHMAISLGKAIEKVFTPVKWLLFGVSAVLILWGIIGLRRRG